MSKRIAHTIAEMLLVMIVIGVIAMMTVPVAKMNTKNHELFLALKSFTLNLDEVVQKWKIENNCFYATAYKCLSVQNLPDNNCDNFNQIVKYYPVVEKAGINEKENLYWLPGQTLNYFGDSESADGLSGVSKKSTGLCRYLLLDGQTLAVDVDPYGFMMIVDVNGSQFPNRVGKDTFYMTIGYNMGKDVNYYAKQSKNGLCGLGEDGQTKCDPMNLNPFESNGASPTTFSLSKQHIPDFSALSETIKEIKP